MASKQGSDPLTNRSEDFLRSTSGIFRLHKDYYQNDTGELKRVISKIISKLPEKLSDSVIYQIRVFDQPALTWQNILPFEGSENSISIVLRTVVSPYSNIFSRSHIPQIYIQTTVF